MIHRAIELTLNSVLWSSSKKQKLFWIYYYRRERERRKVGRVYYVCFATQRWMGCPLANELTHAVAYEPQQPGGSEELTNNCNFHVGSFDATELMMNEKLNLHRSISYQYPYICSLWAMMSVIIDWREFTKNIQFLTVSQPFKFDLLQIFIAKFYLLSWVDTHFL